MPKSTTRNLRSPFVLCSAQSSAPADEFGSCERSETPRGDNVTANNLKVQAARKMFEEKFGAPRTAGDVRTCGLRAELCADWARCCAAGGRVDEGGLG